MRRFAVLLASILAFGAFAVAQMEPKPMEVPNTELFLGYSYQHANTSGFNAESNGLVDVQNTNLSGFAFDVSHYRANRFGATFETAHASTKGVDSTGVKYSRTSYLAGPTYRLRNIQFLTPSVHVLAGVDHDDFTVPETGSQTTFDYRSTVFAATAGATLDGNLSRHVGIRLAQVDYLYTHHFGTSQSSFRYTAGVVFRF